MTNQLQHLDSGFEYIKYKVNPSFYQSFDCFRYIERKYGEKQDSFHIADVEKTTILKDIITKCRHGVTRKELFNYLTERDYTSAQVGGFIKDLISTQIIVSELAPAIIGDPTNNLIQKIEGYKTIVFDEIKSYLQKLKDILTDLNIAPIGEKNAGFLDLKNALSLFATKVSAEKLFKVNTFVNPVRTHINVKMIRHVQEGLDILNILSTTKTNIILEQFKHDFLNRYEDEEVPLTEVIDPDLGIPLSKFTSESLRVHPLIKNISFAKNLDQVDKHYIRHCKISGIIQKKYQELLNSGQSELKLWKSDFKGITPNWDNFSPTFSVGTEIIKAGNYHEPLIHIKFAGGFSACNLLGRFCNDNEVFYQISRKIADHEIKTAPEGSVLAEICYVPDDLSRSKVLSRSAIYPYEIIVNANSYQNEAFQLPLSDLFLSVKKNVFVLRSKKLNKEVIPKNSTADAFKDSANPFYYFLSLLQWNGGIKSHVNFEWGDFGPLNDFYPRIIFEESVILSPAKWHLNQDLIKSADFNAAFSIEREKRRIPDQFYIVSDYDNKLFIDCTIPEALGVLRFELTRSALFIEEYFSIDEDTFVKGVEHGHKYHNEVIFNLFKSTSHAKD